MGRLLLALLMVALPMTANCGKLSWAPKFYMPKNADKLPRSGKDSYCQRPAVAEQIMRALEQAPEIKAAEYDVIDFMESTTIDINVKNVSFSCHGIANISNGQLLPGTFTVRKNAANKFIWQWVNDDEQQE